jgi:hypothetical protein
MKHVSSLPLSSHGPEIEKEERRLKALKRYVLGLMTVEPRPSSFFNTLCRHYRTLVKQFQEKFKKHNAENVSLKRYVLGLMTVEPRPSSFFCHSVQAQ